MKNEAIETESAFLGCIIAGATHELNNVLAVIQESAGLVEDLLLFSPQTALSSGEAISNSLDSINSQIQRGVGLLTQLNRLAHCSDGGKQEIDLGTALEGMTVLCQRFAKMKNVEILPLEAAPDLKLTTRPLVLQMAIFSAIRACLDVVDTDGRIRMELTKTDNWVDICFLIEDNSPDSRMSFGSDTSPHWKALLFSAGQLQGTVKPALSNSGIMLQLPICLDSTF